MVCLVWSWPYYIGEWPLIVWMFVFGALIDLDHIFQWKKVRYLIRNKQFSYRAWKETEMGRGVNPLHTWPALCAFVAISWWGIKDFDPFAFYILHIFIDCLDRGYDGGSNWLIPSCVRLIWHKYG